MPRELWTSGTGQNLSVHTISDCRGEHCSIHNPSDHHMKDWPQHYRTDRGIMERLCKCGVGHPDPDDARIVSGDDSGIHGCCGCCTEPIEDTVERCLEMNMMNGNKKMVFE